jgi:hypothetical protein
MRALPISILFLFLNLQIYGQVITGKVIDASTKEPLIYASIGVIDTSVGTITNEEGVFSLDLKTLPITSVVRFSMIGYRSMSLTIEELSNKNNILRLESETYKLTEVLIKPSGKNRKAGFTGYSLSGICGWVGTDFGKGWELGTKIELGEKPVRIRNLNIRVKEQSFDSILLRLHVRNLAENLPGDELLGRDILFFITKKTGWVETDLSKYNLVFNGDIAVSIEWIRISGINNSILSFAGPNKVKVFGPTIAFNIKINQGVSYYKNGTEAKWKKSDAESPSFYLTVQ